MNYGKEILRVADQQLLVDRISKEAENMEQFVIMLKAELMALGKLYGEDYYDVCIYGKTLDFPNADYVAIGQIAKTEEDFDDDNYGYIVPKSYMKNGDYIVEYEIIYRA